MKSVVMRKMSSIGVLNMRAATKLVLLSWLIRCVDGTTVPEKSLAEPRLSCDIPQNLMNTSDTLYWSTQGSEKMFVVVNETGLGSSYTASIEKTGKYQLQIHDPIKTMNGSRVETLFQCSVRGNESLEPLYKDSVSFTALQKRYFQKTTFILNPPKVHNTIPVLTSNNVTYDPAGELQVTIEAPLPSKYLIAAQILLKVRWGNEWSGHMLPLNERVGSHVYWLEDMKNINAINMSLCILLDKSICGPAFDAYPRVDPSISVKDEKKDGEEAKSKDGPIFCQPVSESPGSWTSFYHKRKSVIIGSGLAILIIGLLVILPPATRRRRLMGGDGQSPKTSHPVNKRGDKRKKEEVDTVAELQVKHLRDVEEGRAIQEERQPKDDNSVVEELQNVFLSMPEVSMKKKKRHQILPVMTSVDLEVIKEEIDDTDLDAVEAHEKFRMTQSAADLETIEEYDVDSLEEFDANEKRIMAEVAGGSTCYPPPETESTFSVECSLPPIKKYPTYPSKNLNLVRNLLMFDRDDTTSMFRMFHK